jgi:hypothetical protein
MECIRAGVAFKETELSNDLVKVMRSLLCSSTDRFLTTSMDCLRGECDKCGMSGLDAFLKTTTTTADIETLHPNVGFEQFEYVVLPSSDLQAPAAPRDHSQQVVQQQGVVEELNEMASNSNSQPEASNNASSDADESEPAVASAAGNTGKIEKPKKRMDRVKKQLTLAEFMSFAKSKLQR